jgi:hypothetical protein
MMNIPVMLPECIIVRLCCLQEACRIAAAVLAVLQCMLQQLCVSLQGSEATQVLPVVLAGRHTIHQDPLCCDVLRLYSCGCCGAVGVVC